MAFEYEFDFHTNGEKVNAADILNKFEYAIANILEHLNGITEWENENTTVAFPAQEIEVYNDGGVKYYEVLYMDYTTRQYLMTTGKIPIGNATQLNASYGAAYSRVITPNYDESAGTLTFNIATGYKATTANTTCCIPAAIKLYYI